MDLSNVKVSDWLMIAAGVIMLIFGLVLDWAEYAGVGGNGPFDYFFTGGISWILVVAVGVIAGLLAFGAIKPSATPWTLILLGASGLATLLMLIRVLMGGGEESALGQSIDLDRGIGMYVAFIAAIAAVAGAVMKFTESGGNLKDLTDVNKIRGEFQQGRGGGATPPSSGGSTPPPPPSGGGTPPPPPPPGS